MEREAGVILRMSVPMIRGEEFMAHMLKCSLYSSSVMPPLPTSSMSMSDWAPDCVFETMEAILFRMLRTEQWKPGRAHL